MVEMVGLWNRARRVPFGRQVFSVMFSRRAPYFRTVRPTFVVVEPNRVELTVRNRRAVQNHLGTMHAMALCNGLEAAMGALAEATVPSEKRWIPRGFEVRYLAKVEDQVRCIAETDPSVWTGSHPKVPVQVRAELPDGTVAAEGVIHLWVTPIPRSRQQTT